MVDKQYPLVAVLQGKSVIRNTNQNSVAMLQYNGMVIQDFGGNSSHG